MTKTDLIKTILLYLQKEPELVLRLFSESQLRKVVILSERRNDRTGLSRNEFVNRQMKKHGLSKSCIDKMLQRNKKS